MKILFLDFDGPVIPQRVYTYNIQHYDRACVHWDPSAAAIVKDVLLCTGAKLVISSAWRRQGYDRIVKILEYNGISEAFLHKDWRTETDPDDTRANRILRWVEQHPAVTEWVAVDDEPLSEETKHGNSKIGPHFVHVTLEDGILHKHHGQLLYHLLRDEVEEGCSSWALSNHNWLWCDGCKPLFATWRDNQKPATMG